MSSAVAKEYERLREDIRKLEEKIEQRVGPLIRQKQLKERQLKALHEYLSLNGSVPGEKSTPASGRVSGSAKAALDAAADILAAGPQPMHYTDLYQAVAERGFQIPGEKPEANFLTHLNRDVRFVRVRPGTYGLREDGALVGVSPNGVASDGHQPSERESA